jgi:RES domain-containing protein
MVYFALSRAMAVMEVLVHIRPEEIDRDFVLAVFEVLDDSLLTIDIADLPKNWKKESEVETLKGIGNKFIKDNKFLLMKVPSIIIEEDYNLVFNPNHHQSDQIKLVEKRLFKFDLRFKK